MSRLQQLKRFYVPVCHDYQSGVSVRWPQIRVSCILKDNMALRWDRV